MFSHKVMFTELDHNGHLNNTHYSDIALNSLPEHHKNEFLSQMDRELFCIVNLQADLTPINMNIVSVGSLNEALINPREIFKSAILSNAHSMMLIHNHPSGYPEPSREDLIITRQIHRISRLQQECRN